VSSTPLQVPDNSDDISKYSQGYDISVTANNLVRVMTGTYCRPVLGFYPHVGVCLLLKSQQVHPLLRPRRWCLWKLCYF
jgi:hypothetical protein